MRKLREAIAAAAAPIMLAGCAGDSSSSNPACDTVDSAAASEALNRKVQAEPSPIEGFFYSCEYYVPDSRKALGV